MSYGENTSFTHFTIAAHSASPNANALSEYDALPIGIVELFVVASFAVFSTVQPFAQRSRNSTRGSDPSASCAGSISTGGAPCGAARAVPAIATTDSNARRIA